jgi:hypothetical protein
MRAPPPARIVAAMALWVAANPTVAPAQELEDATRDHEEQDRRYLERRERAAESPTPTTPPDRAAERAAFLARAEELIRDRHYRSASGRHYRVQTDDPRVDADAVVALLDALRGFFDAFWSNRVRLEPYEAESRVLLFYSFKKFDQLVGGERRFLAERPKGHYLPWLDVITIHTDPGGPSSLGETLVHEATHQLVEQRMFGGDAPDALWLAEGLASYFGATLVDRDGVFHAGAIGGKGVGLLKTGERESGAVARALIAGLEQAAKDAGKRPLAFTDVLDIVSPREFYEGDPGLNYGSSWLLVHLLLHGEGGAHEAAFTRWLTASAEQPDAGQALLRALGRSRTQLDAAALAHLRRLKSRDPRGVRRVRRGSTPYRPGRRRAASGCARCPAGRSTAPAWPRPRRRAPRERARRRGPRRSRRRS